MSTSRPSTPFLALALAAVFAAATPAWSGCGCDHPPPDWALVMPPFASPGKTLTLHAPTPDFVVGETYTVEFESDAEVDVVAESVAILELEMPGGVDPGPVEIRVRGNDFDHTYPSSLFTALSPAVLVPAQDGAWHLKNFAGAVAEDGTLLIPMNLSQVSDATQFALQLGKLRLAFGAEDIVFYNSDGVDLTLFTLDVSDPTERTWGSYYGWDVKRDGNIMGAVYEKKKKKSKKLASLSDLVTYWRHEFHTYNAAHAVGGTHEVGANGYHADLGTLHIDHDHLVLAIYGGERDALELDDDTKHRVLNPGKRTLDVYFSVVQSDNPIEPLEMEDALSVEVDAETTAPMGIEDPSTYDND